MEDLLHDVLGLEHSGSGHDGQLVGVDPGPSHLEVEDHVELKKVGLLRDDKLQHGVVVLLRGDQISEGAFFVGILVDFPKLREGGAPCHRCVRGPWIPGADAGFPLSVMLSSADGWFRGFPGNNAGDG